MSYIVNVLLYVGAEKVYGPYGVQYNASSPPKKVRINATTSFEEFLYSIYQKLNLRYGVDRVVLSYRFQSTMVQGMYPYFSEVAVADDAELSDMYEMAVQGGIMYVDVLVEVQPDNVYIPVAAGVYDESGPSHVAEVPDLNMVPFAVDEGLPDSRFDAFDSEPEDIDEDIIVNGDIEDDVAWEEGVGASSGDVPTHLTGGFEEMPEDAEELMRDSIDVGKKYVFFDERKVELQKGMFFPSKEAVQIGVHLYSIKVQRETVTQQSNPNVWRAVCKKRRDANNPCHWDLRAMYKKKSGMWQVTQYNGVHSCYDDRPRADHRNLSVHVVARAIQHFVRQKPNFEVGFVRAHVKEKFHVDITYLKAWRARNKAIADVFGDWEESFNLLPRFLMALRKFNNGTVVKFKYWSSPESTPNVRILDYVFWAFGPCVAAWKHLRPVMCIDGTHLRGQYRGHLLTALGVDAKEQLVPLAFAIVEGESNTSWSWFIRQLYASFMVGMSEVCIISDRHQSISSALHQLQSTSGVQIKHRVCLRHLKSNVKKQFKNQTIKDLTWKAGTEVKRVKHDRAIDTIRDNDPNGVGRQAANYLNAIEKEKWTLCEDGGYRWGIMTTNMAECFNGVLVGARYLPITALVNHIFLKCAEYFCRRGADADKLLGGEQIVSPTAKDMYERWERKSYFHNVFNFHYATGTAQVGRMLEANGQGENVHVVKMIEKSCTCGKWIAYHVPCSHALAVARNNGIRISPFLPKEFSASTYKKTYETPFQSLGDGLNWPNGPDWVLKPQQNRRRERRSGPSADRRITNEMDRSDVFGRRHCSGCGVAGHVITNCPRRNG